MFTQVELVACEDFRIAQRPVVRRRAVRQRIAFPLEGVAGQRNAAVAAVAEQLGEIRCVTVEELLGECPQPGVRAPRRNVLPGEPGSAPALQFCDIPDHARPSVPQVPAAEQKCVAHVAEIEVRVLAAVAREPGHLFA
ncbi:hypothetical protein SMICM17S_00622 [Streptomyces microflavus]